MKKKEDLSPRLLIFFLEHPVYKPGELVQQRMEVPTFIINTPEPQDNAENAGVVDEEKFSLPEPE